MNFKLPYFNLVAVVVLSILCVFQWKQNSDLHRISLQNEKLLLLRNQELSEQKSQLNEAMADLARFKEQYGTTHRELTENSKSLKTMRQENLQLLNETDRLRTSVSNWMQAATLRDNRIVEGNEKIKKLADDLNSSVLKYNQLASNYNSVVKQLNEALQKMAGAAPKKAD